MSRPRPHHVIGAVALIAILAGCTLPIRQLPTPTPFVFPTQVPSPLPLVATATLPPVVVATATFPPVPTAELPTATPVTPTATSVPPTATLPTTRSGLNVIAAYTGTPPTLDGDWGEWSAKQYPCNFVVFGDKGADQAFEGSFRVAWDKNNLYIAAKVHDDNYVQEATGQYIYKGDSLEILLDTNLTGDFFTRALDGDDYQLGISPGQKSTVNNNPEAYLWFPSGRAGSQSSVQIGATSSTGLYRVEAAIPWSVFHVSPYSGEQFGFAFSISGDDNTGTQQQQVMISSDANRVLVDPTTWGNLTLQ